MVKARSISHARVVDLLYSELPCYLYDDHVPSDKCGDNCRWAESQCRDRLIYRSDISCPLRTLDYWRHPLQMDCILEVELITHPLYLLISEPIPSHVRASQAARSAIDGIISRCNITLSLCAVQHAAIHLFHICGRPSFDLLRLSQLANDRGMSVPLS